MTEIREPGDRTVLCFCPSPSSSLTHVCLANDEEDEEEEEERKERVQEERHMAFSSPLNIRHVRRFGGKLKANGGWWVGRTSVKLLYVSREPNHQLLVGVCVCFSPKFQETLQIIKSKYNNVIFLRHC